MDETFRLEQAVEEAVRRDSMIPDSAAVLAAISGGADSTALLLVLCALAKRRGWHVEALHVEHGIRGEESRADADFVARLCRSQNVPVTVVSKDVPALARQQKTGLEETARNVRRARLLARAAEMERELGGRPVVIATAHHAGDNAETMLFHLARGTGAAGLCGIRPVQGAFVRPLLYCTREQIEAYLTAAGMPWRTDSTNTDPAYARNRIRLDAIPALRAVNDGAVRHMSEAARSMQELEAWLSRAAEELLARWEDADGVLRRGLAEEDPVPAKEAVRRWLARRAPAMVERVHTETAWQMLARGSGQLSMPGGGVIRAAADGLHVFTEPPAAEKAERMNPVVVHVSPGQTAEIDAGGMHFSFQVRDARPNEAEDARRDKTYTFCRDCGNRGKTPLCGARAFGAGCSPVLKCLKHFKTYTKRFDYDKIEQISIRTRQPGDTLVIGENRHKSLRRYFMDIRVPEEERGERLLLCDGSDVLWVIGARMGDRCKLTEATRRVLEVRVTGADGRREEKSMSEHVRLMIPEEDIDRRIRELGEQISKDYAGKTIYLTGILKGASFFACELAKRITVPVIMDFMATSSYGGGTVSTGKITVSKKTDLDPAGREVLIVEDIVDSGNTLAFLKPYFKEAGAASVRTAVLLDKPDRREVEISADYTGFTIPDEFVVGYGLDYDQKYRNLPYIGVVSFED